MKRKLPAYEQACKTDLNHRPPHVRERALRRAREWSKEKKARRLTEGSALYRAAEHRLMLKRRPSARFPFRG